MVIAEKLGSTPADVFDNWAKSYALTWRSVRG